MHIVVTNPDLPGSPRAAVAPEAVPDMELRGWTVVGPTSTPSAEPLLTDEEQADAAAELAARVAAWQDQLTPQHVDDVDADTP